MIADRKVGLCQLQLSDGFQYQEGERIYRVYAAGQLSADTHILVKRASRRKFSMRVAPYFIDGKGL